MIGPLGGAGRLLMQLLPGGSRNGKFDAAQGLHARAPWIMEH
jgi:hypothetical protein